MRVNAVWSEEYGKKPRSKGRKPKEVIEVAQASEEEEENSNSEQESEADSRRASGKRASKHSPRSSPEQYGRYKSIKESSEPTYKRLKTRSDYSDSRHDLQIQEHSKTPIKTEDLRLKTMEDTQKTLSEQLEGMKKSQSDFMDYMQQMMMKMSDTKPPAVKKTPVKTEKKENEEEKVKEKNGE
jgi:hypothetical protein